MAKLEVVQVGRHTEHEPMDVCCPEGHVAVLHSFDAETIQRVAVLLYQDVDVVPAGQVRALIDEVNHLRAEVSKLARQMGGK